MPSCEFLKAWIGVAACVGPLVNLCCVRFRFVRFHRPSAIVSRWQRVRGSLFSGLGRTFRPGNGQQKRTFCQSFDVVVYRTIEGHQLPRRELNPVLVRHVEQDFSFQRLN